MRNITNPYSPCPCGSGKKYKFCCYLKRDEMSSVGRMHGAFSSPISYIDGKPIICFDEEELDEGNRLLHKGLQVMNSGEYKKAIPIFRRALAIAPLINSCANNLALCLQITGKLDEAIQVQQETLETNPLPNPFGLINLATLHYITGDEFSTQRFLQQALDTKIPSEDACVKVCEMLARFKRHSDILDFTSKTEWKSCPNVCFYTGVAAANLGDLKRAKKDLQKVPIGHSKASMVIRYLDHLRDNTAPHTVRGDWPYLLPQEVCPFDVGQYAKDKDAESWSKRAILVEFCEALFNETADDPIHTLDILAGLKHPKATELLWTIVNGKFGPDSLRLSALDTLRKINVDVGECCEIFLKGKYEKIVLLCTSLNPDFHFGEPLPQKLDKQYIKAVISLQGSRPNWKLIDQTFQQILLEKPDYYPAKFNYAVALMRRGRRSESVPLILDVVEKHPEYLFARTALLQILLDDGKIKDAEELIKTMPFLKETHPDAMAAWMTGQALYHQDTNSHEMALECIKSAYSIAPELPMVEALWDYYQSMFAGK